MLGRKKKTDFDLHGKIAIITGAGSGIGRELACEFARAGVKIVCCGRTESKLKKTVSIIRLEGGDGIVIPTDVTYWKQVQRMVQITLKKFHKIDLLFNNAGSYKQVGPLWEADPEVWWNDVSVNLYGSMLCCRAVLPHMIERDKGIIINMDGGGGSNGPNIGGSAYGCSKFALLRLSECLARELEREGSSVMVFCINPGFVRTNMTENLISTPEKLKWQKIVKELMGSELEMPPNACAKSIMKLLEISGGELSGRIFYVDTDFEEIERRKEEIKKENLYVMHLITLKGKLTGWPLVKKEKDIRITSKK